LPDWHVSVMKMSEPRRQHPLVILVNALKGLRHMLLPAAAVFVVRGLDQGFVWSWWILLAVAGLFALSVIVALWRWFFFWYYYQDNALHTKSGCFIKKHRHIKRERVQTVNLRAGLIYRAFSLATLNIETAGGYQEPEIKVEALTLPTARALQAELKGSKKENSGEEEDVEEKETGLYHADLKTLFVAGMTSGGVGVVMSIALAVFSQFFFLIPDDWIEDVVTAGIGASLLVLALVLFSFFLASWIVSIVRYIIRYAFFTVDFDGEELQITHGLIIRRQLSLKLYRVQAVSIIEGIIRQPFGFATVELEVAGGSAYDEGTRVTLFPLLRRNQVDDMLAQTLPSFVYRGSLNEIPPRALRRYLFRGLAPLLVVPIGAYFHPLAWLGLVLAPPLFALAWLRYKDAGYALDNDRLITRSRVLSRTTGRVARPQIQAFAVNRNILQRLRRLATIQQTVVSAPSKMVYQVKDLEAGDAVGLFSWFSRSE